MERACARRRLWQRIALIAGLVVLFVVGSAVGGLFYAESRIRSKVETTLSERLGRQVSVQSATLRVGRLTLKGISISGSSSSEPAMSMADATLDFDWRTVFGDQALEVRFVRLAGITAKATRYADGSSDWDDVAAKIVGENASPELEAASPAKRLPVNVPALIQLAGADLQVVDEAGRFSSTISIGSGSFDRHTLLVDLMGINVSAVDPVLGDLAAANRDVNVAGSIRRLGGNRFNVDITTSYGAGKDEQWQANGTVSRQHADLDLQFDATAAARAGHLFEGTPVVPPASATLHGTVNAKLDPQSARIQGDLRVFGLALEHPLVASDPVTGIDGRGEFLLTWDRQRDIIELEPSTVWLGSPGQDSRLAVTARFVAAGPNQTRALDATLKLERTPCDRVLKGLPAGAAPKLAGFELAGTMAADLSIEIDWTNLDATGLKTDVDLNDCTVVKAPPRLTKEALGGSFEHRVPVNGEWMTFVVGPENPNFAPLDTIAPNLVRSVIYTEDPGFYKHAGFSREFRLALIRNLEEGKFAWGGSSITNQMVKNVFLAREKTLRRKFQELALTWHVERSISKERILEIYFNAIEYGPGLYGVKPAAQAYFQRDPNRLGIVESAFISTLLPAPHVRYKQFCENKVQEWTELKIERIVDNMWRHKRLNDDQYFEALEVGLHFRGKPEDSKMCSMQAVATR